MIEITESNCNYHLDRLYKERDQISAGIDRLVSMGRDIRLLEKEYNEKCDLIDLFLEFRRSHDCLLKGDPGYGPM